MPSSCEHVYGVAGGSFTVVFRFSTLTGNSADTADYGDLALVTVDLTTVNATSTERKMDALLGGGGGHFTMP